jgi:hypothetical protein
MISVIPQKDKITGNNCGLKCLKDWHRENDKDFGDLTRRIEECKFNKLTRICSFNEQDIKKKVVSERIPEDLHLELCGVNV